VREILLVAAGGALGAVARFLVALASVHYWGDRFDWGTLLVNVFGSVLLGLVMHLNLTSDLVSREMRLAIAVGLCGALTTFSTFSYETARYLQAGDLRLAFANIAGNVVLCLLGAAAGLALGKAITGP